MRLNGMSEPHQLDSRKTIHGLRHRVLPLSHLSYNSMRGDVMKSGCRLFRSSLNGQCSVHTLCTDSLNLKLDVCSKLFVPESTSNTSSGAGTTYDVARISQSGPGLRCPR